MKHRLVGVKLFFTLWTLWILARLVYWQVIRAPDLSRLGQLQYGSVNVLLASRGEIKSRDGFPLVKNQEAYLAYVDPSQLKLTPPKQQALFQLLSATVSAKQVIEMAKTSRLSWLPLAHFLSPDVKTALEQLDVPGLGFEPEPSRINLEGSASAYLTGFVGKNALGEPQGYFGLEGYYDRVLTG